MRCVGKASPPGPFLPTTCSAHPEGPLGLQAHTSGQGRAPAAPRRNSATLPRSGLSSAVSLERTAPERGPAQAPGPLGWGILRSRGQAGTVSGFDTLALQTPLSVRGGTRPRGHKTQGRSSVAGVDLRGRRVLTLTLTRESKKWTETRPCPMSGLSGTLFSFKKKIHF